MKIIATERLNRTYVQRLGRYTYIATAVTALVITLSLLWTLFHIGGDKAVAYFSGLTLTLAALLGASGVFYVAYLAKNGPVLLGARHRLAWLLIGLGLLSKSIGAAYGFYLVSIGKSHFPSYTDIFFTLFYPLIFAGLVLMPVTFRFRKRIAVDALFTTLCLLGVSWFFLIGPAYLKEVSHANSLTNFLKLLLILSYPCWDLVLILAIVLVILRRVERILYPSLILFGIGIFSSILADSIHAYTIIFMAVPYLRTPSIIPLWTICCLLLSLAAFYQYTIIAYASYGTQALPFFLQVNRETTYLKHHEQASSGWRRLRNLLIYIPLTLLLVLTIYGELVHDDPISHALVIFTAIVGILAASRYLLATHENEILLQEREQRQEDAEALRRITNQLTEVLEYEPLLALIAHLATSALGFDAALVAVVEDQNWPLHPYSSLLVNTANSGAAQPRSWRFQGENFLYHTILAQKEVQAAGDQFTLDMSPEIYAWQQEQHVHAMCFFPLLYQGKLQGCIGLARNASLALNKHDLAISRAYVEQVATVLEHVYLYQSAREQEAFARAMANIASRLNAAVVEPVEIYHLICQEAASALRVDHVLLYVPGEDGNLMPLAAYIGEQESIASPRDWPLIHAHEYEARILYSLQPVLLHLVETQPFLLPGTPTTSAGKDFHRRLSGSHLLPVSVWEQRKRYTLREQLVQHFVQTTILAPLVAKGDPAGMLVLGRSLPPGMREQRHLDTSNLAAVQDFVEQAAIAFTNARLYQHLQTAHQRLQELDQLKDQFMVTASHELRTPLTAVQGYIELLAQYEDMLPPEQRREFLQKVRRSCDELVVMLGNVMDASRLEVEAGIKPALIERISVQEIVKSVIELIEPQAMQEQRELYMSIPSHLFIYADPLRLRQVLMNVSVNALKYSPPQTPVMFSARAVTPPQYAPFVVISIKDQGEGIQPQDAARLFQRFVRLERDVNSPVRGSGLGLYISRRLVEAMDGKIWVESLGVPGQGSIFHIQLPMAY